ncbi:MAG: outer membrane lipoprotein chaperone LolA [Burkholderiales bacterium]
MKTTPTLLRNFLAASCCLCLLGTSAAQASSLDRLHRFVQSTQTGKSHFTQLVLDKKLATVQEANGTLEFSRPGKFRWTYEKPQGQLIVGDGEKVWVYDAELKQVTVRKLDQALGSTPAALLAGRNDLEKFFVLKDLGKRGSLEWLEATPKSKESGFELIRMGFKGDLLDVMELRDNFGQTTVIRFPDLQRNPVLSPDRFTFTPPKGADVIGE